MSTPVITVNGLSKRFILQHEQRERYTSLRDVIARKARNIFRKGTTDKARDEFWALKDIDLVINAGDRIGIIGRNGAGKSTLLKVLSRIIEPTRGRIEINGRVASLLEVGTGFHPELSGRENIFLNGAILGMSSLEIRRKFDEIVAFAEVERFLDTPVKRYSSGMYVRLAFAVAAHLEPEILIVDEVLAVGDAQFQKKCLGKMENVSRNEGRTVLFVSHQMDAIETLTTKAFYLKNGQIKSTGATSEIVHEYLRESEPNISIRDYKNRQGSGKARIVKLDVLDDNGNKVTMIRQGQSFVVVVGIENDTSDTLDVSFVLESYREHPLFCTQLSDSNGKIDSKGYSERQIVIDVPYIRKGDYLASLALFRTDKSEFHDVVLHFPLLSVDGIVENMYFPNDNRWGDLYFPLIWR